MDNLQEAQSMFYMIDRPDHNTLQDTQMVIVARALMAQAEQLARVADALEKIASCVQPDADPRYPGYFNSGKTSAI